MAKKKKIETITEMTPAEKLISIPPLVKLTFVEEDNQLKVSVKQKLDISEVRAFTNVVVDYLIDKESESISYANKDFAIAYCTLSFYTDIEFPDDESIQHRIINNTPILAKVMDTIDEKQYWHILDGIDEQLRVEEQKMQNQFKLEAQAHLDQIKLEAESIVSAFKKFAEAFKDVNPEDVAKIIPKIANSEDIGKAVVDAYMSRTSDKPNMEVVK